MKNILKIIYELTRFLFLSFPAFLIVSVIAIVLVGVKHFVLKVKSLLIKPSSKVDSRTNNQNTQ
jgi:hypothetical protein